MHDISINMTDQQTSFNASSSHSDLPIAFHVSSLNNNDNNIILPPSNNLTEIGQARLMLNDSELFWMGHNGSYGGPHAFPTIKQPTYMVVVYAVAYSIIFFTALIGNALVVAVVMTRPGMRSVTNLFIANLAIADILVAVFCIPITLLDNIFSGWPFGATLCKLTPYVQGVTVCASVYNLAAIAVDRYVAICFKPQRRIMRRGACITLAAIWLFSLAIMIPWLVYYQHYDGIHTIDFSMCQPIWPNIESEKAFFIIAIFLGTYLVPLVVVFMCYILIVRRVWLRKAPGVTIGYNVIKRYKMRVIKMMVTVVTLFALSWMPLHVIYLFMYFNPPSEQVQIQLESIGIPLAQWLELSNSGMNAIIYCFFSENFRRGFFDVCNCVARRKRGRRDSFSLHQPKSTRSPSEEYTLCVMRSTQLKCHGKGLVDSRGNLLERRFVFNGRKLEISPGGIPKIPLRPSGSNSECTSNRTSMSSVTYLGIFG